MKSHSRHDARVAEKGGLRTFAPDFCVNYGIVPPAPGTALRKS